MTKRNLGGAIAASLLVICGLLAQIRRRKPPRGQNVTLTQAQLQQDHALHRGAAHPTAARWTPPAWWISTTTRPARCWRPSRAPVSRLLVQPGDKVKKGDALAAVVSPDFATAVSTYRKALVTAENARRLADLDKDLLAHQGRLGARRSNRPRPTLPAPKPTAMPRSNRCSPSMSRRK